MYSTGWWVWSLGLSVGVLCIVLGFTIGCSTGYSVWVLCRRCSIGYNVWVWLSSSSIGYSVWVLLSGCTVHSIWVLLSGSSSTGYSVWLCGVQWQPGLTDYSESPLVGDYPPSNSPLSTTFLFCFVLLKSIKRSKKTFSGRLPTFQLPTVNKFSGLMLFYSKSIKRFKKTFSGRLPTLQLPSVKNISMLTISIFAYFFLKFSFFKEI